MSYTIQYRSYDEKLNYVTKTITTNSLADLQEKCHNILVKMRKFNDDSLIVFPNEYHFTDNNEELFIRNNDTAFQQKTLVAMNVTPVVNSIFYLVTKLDDLAESSIRNAYSINMSHFSMLDYVEKEQLDLPFGTLDITDIRHLIPNLPNGYAVDITAPGIDAKTKQTTTFEGCILKYSESDFGLIFEI